MPWFDREKDKKKLGKWGDKTEEEILAALNKSESLETENTTLKTSVAEKDKAVGTLSTNFEALKNRFDASIEENRRNAPPPPKKDDAEPADFITDPELAFNQRAQPLAQATAQTAAMVAKMQAQQQLQRGSKDGIDARLFEHWDAEIGQIAQNTPITILANPRTWLGIFLQVKGYHADELASPETRKEKYAFLEPSASQIPPPAAGGKQDEPTDVEKKIAEKMGIPIADYMKQKKSMTFVGA